MMLVNSLILLCLQQGKNTEKPAGLLQSKSQGPSISFSIHSVHLQSAMNQNINRPPLAAVFVFTPVCLFTHHLTERTHTGRVPLWSLTEIVMSFPNVRLKEIEGAWKSLELHRRDVVVFGWGGSETRAGWICYRGLFLEETQRLWDTGVVSKRGIMGRS